MPIEIIPAILEVSWKNIERKLKLIQGLCAWVQIDVMDGVFVPNTTWRTPHDLVRVNSTLNIEIHLMVDRPERTLLSWLTPRAVKRVIVHAEATDRLEDVFATAHGMHKQIGLAINPKTPIASIQQFLPQSALVLVMGVEPGFSGQAFDASVLIKIQQLRKLDARIPIAVDGGVNEKTAPHMKAAGATILYAASYLWQEEAEIPEKINTLKQIP